YANQDYTFGKIIEAVKPDRKLDRNPIYNVGFLLQNFIRGFRFGSGLEARQIALDRSIEVQLDLRFVAVPNAKTSGMTMICDYRGELFDEETIEQVLEGYRRILSEVVREGDVRIGRVELPEGLEGRGERGRERRERETIAISATFTAEPVEDALVYWIEQMEMECGIEFAPYNQVFQQLLDKESLLRRNRRGLNVLLVRVEDWHKQGVSGRGGIEEEEAEEEKLRESVKRLGEAIKTAARRGTTPYLVVLCPESRKAREEGGLAGMYAGVEEGLKEEMKEVAGVTVVSSRELEEKYPVKDYYDEGGEEQWQIPYSEEMYAGIGTMIARKLYVERSEPAKAVVLDCDGTLWKGVVGEEGAEGIKVEGGHKALQEFMKEQQRGGMLLCICSK